MLIPLHQKILLFLLWVTLALTISCKERGSSSKTNEVSLETSRPAKRTEGLGDNEVSATKDEDTETAPSSSEAAPVEKHLKAHKISLRNPANQRSIQVKAPLPNEALELIESLGNQVKIEKEGRSGNVLHILPSKDSSAAETLAQLKAAGIVTGATLIQLRMESSHEHQKDSCASCLVPNYKALENTRGVISIPRYLIGKNSEHVDVLINKDQVTVSEIIEKLEVDYSSVTPL